MATKRIERSDLVAPNAIKSVTEETKILIIELEKLLIVQREMVKTNAFKNSKDVKKFNDDLTVAKSTTKALETAQKQLKKSTEAEAKAKIIQANATKKQKQELQDLIIQEDKQAGTLQKLAASSRTLRREREGLNFNTKKGADRLKEINIQLDKNNLKVTKNSDALKKQKLNVGNYSQGVQEGITATGLFSQQLFILQRIQAVVSLLTKKQAVETAALATTQTAAASSTNLVTKSLTFLKIALISTGIGAIVVAVGALTAAFFSTQRGADALTRVITPLKVIFELFVGFLQDTSFKVFDRLKKAIDDPAKAFKDLGKAIAENVLNRFTAIAELGDAVGKVIQGIIDRDFSLIGEGLEDAGNATLKVATGIDDIVGSVKDLAEETRKATEAALADGKKLADIEIELERIRIRNTVPLAKQNFLYKESVKLANDQNKTDEERILGLINAEKALIKANNLRKEEIQAELDVAELKSSFNDTDRKDQLEIEKIKARLFESDTEFQKKSGALTSLRTGIEKKAINEIAKAKKKAFDEQRKREQEEKDRLIDFNQTKEDLENAYTDSLLSDEQREINAVRDKYFAIIEMAKKNKDDITTLEAAQKAEIDAIKAKTTEEEEEEEEEEKKQKQREENVKTIIKGIDAVSDAMSRASEKRLEGFDRETEENATALDRQERRAEQGLENNAAALQAQQDKLEAQKVREQEEQERRQKILAYFNLAAEYAKDDANTAPFKALATIGTMEAITALFEEGTDKGVEADMSGSKVRNTGKDDYLGRTKSGKAFLFDGREKIMGIQHSAALTDYTNQQIVDIVQNSEKGGMMASISLNDSRIVSRLDSLEKSINNSKVSLHIDENAFVTHTQFVNGMKKVSKSKPKRLY